MDFLQHQNYIYSKEDEHKRIIIVECIAMGMGKGACSRIGDLVAGVDATKRKWIKELNVCFI